MKTLAHVPVVVAILLVVSLPPAFGQAKDTPKPAFRFRGVEAGSTSQAELLKNSKWGTPESRTIHKSGDRFWEYRPRGYKKIVVLLRGGIVQTVDVTLPAGITPEKAAEAFGLGKPATGKLPQAAGIGGEIPKTWTPAQYTAGRVLLYVEKIDGRSTANVMRIYADRVLSSAAAPSIALPEVKVTLTGQDDTSRRVARKVVEMLEKHHVARLKLNDKIATGWMKRFIKRLDPGKYYFLQSDIDRFMRLSSGIDDKARLGDVGFAYAVFKTFAQRRTKSMEFANGFLGGKFDFTADEKFMLPTKTTAYPENELEAREIWRKRIKRDILVRKSQGANGGEALDRVSRHYRQVFQLPSRIDDDELIAWCLQDLAHAFDPHCDYFSARRLRDFRIQTRAQMVGIGASLKTIDGYTVVTQIVPGSPSGKDGRLQAGDRIVGVAQGNGEFLDVVSKRLPGVVDRIRGKLGTVVRLKVIPKDQKQTRIYEITRGTISLQRIDSRVMTKKDGDEEFRIGVVKVPTYYGDSRNKATPNSTDDTRKVLRELAAQKVDLVVIDFRSHGGGVLREAIRFPGLFLRKGPLLQFKNSTGKVGLYNVGDAKRAWDGPLIVLTNRFTSSGAEIFVGAVQDYRRGLVIGDSSTNGNGCVQNLYDIGRELAGRTKGDTPQLGSARVTTQTMYRVTGKTWQRRGVVPDVIVPSIYDLPSYGEIAYENSLKPASINAAAFGPLHWVDAELRRHVAARSQARRETNPQFAAYLKSVAENAKWRSRTSTTLKESDFLAEYRAYQQAIANLKTGTEKADPLLNETLDVAADYLGRIGWHREYTAAMGLLRRREFAKSAAKFTEILTAHANLKIAHAGRALAYAGQGDWDRAVKDAKQAGVGIPCRVTKATAFRAGERTVAQAPVGTRVLVTKVTAGWLWSEANSKTKGWIETRFLKPVTDE